MIGQTSGIEKTVECTTLLPVANVIVMFGADDDTVSLATSSTDDLIAVTQHTTENAGDRVRIMLSGVTLVKLGGTVTRGKFGTAMSGGLAVEAAPAAGVNASVIGKFMASGVAGDIVPLLLAPGQIQG